MRIFILLSLIAYVYGQDGQNLCGAITTPSGRDFVDDPSACEAFLWCRFSDGALVDVHQGNCPTGSVFINDACDFNGGCTEKCEFIQEPTRVADPTDTTCRNFVICDGTTVGTDIFSCPSPSVFNRNFGVCTSESIAPCSGGGSGGGGGGNAVCGPEDEGFINDPSSCAGFIFCKGSGVAGETGTCPDGFHFHPVDLFCVEKEKLDPPCVDSAKMPMRIEIPMPPLRNVEFAARKKFINRIQRNLN